MTGATNKVKHTCYDVANYFLKCQRVEAGEYITNMKLQKLVYYAQGIYLAMKNEPLFDEVINAWDYGPACEELYQKYKQYDKNPIPIPFDLNTLEIFDKETREILDLVYNHYGEYSAWGLSNLSHEEPTWKNAYKRGRDVITHESMREYFITQLENDEE